MLANTYTLDGAVDITVTRINQDSYSSEYRYLEAAYGVTMKVRHSRVKATLNQLGRDRHNVEIVKTIFATTTDPEKIIKTYFVWEVPAGYTDQDMVKYLTNWLSASTFAILPPLLNWES